jgi:hypothetical protein
MHIAWPLTEAQSCLGLSFVNGSGPHFHSRAACGNSTKSRWINLRTIISFVGLAEFTWHIKQIPTCRLVFGDKKPLKGDELFTRWRWGRADPLTGIVEDIVIDSDWQNTYAITGLCRIGRDRPPFSFTVHDGSNNAGVFCDFVIQNLACGFLQPGDFLVLDNASIHHFQESTGLDSYLWNCHGIILQFLPTRSPELNPIEPSWNVLVQRLRHFPLSGPEDNGPRTHRVA